MANFFRSLFSSTNTSDERRKEYKVKQPNRESQDGIKDKGFSAPYDTKRKLSISRSGRMKQNLKARGKLGNDLYGEIHEKKENTKIEYHVNKTFGEAISAEQNLKNNERLKIPEETLQDKTPKENLHEILENREKNLITIEEDEYAADLVKFTEDIDNILKLQETDF